MVPVVANGQPAAAAYLRGDDGVRRAFGVAVLTTNPIGIARVLVFGDPGLTAGSDPSKAV
jgi:RNA polymerase sigma-70 factor, ECF subfamily